MKARTLRITGISLLFSAAQVCSAQAVQTGVGAPSSALGFNVMQMSVTAPVSVTCVASAPNAYQMIWGFVPFGQTYGDTATYFTMPPGSGADATYALALQVIMPPDAMSHLTSMISISKKGPDMLTRPADVVSMNSIPGTQITTMDLIMHYPPGNAWEWSGVQEFGLRMFFDGFMSEGQPIYQMDVRFKAIMVGPTYTDVMGYYNAPSLPLYILRDPPGDGSYSQFSTGNTVCFGQSQSVSNSSSANTWFKAKVGVSGQVGFGVTTDYSIYGEVGVSLDASRSQTDDFEYKTCIEATNTFTTSNSGPPDDMFIGSAVRYAYGMYNEIKRPDCAHVIKIPPHFASEPVGVLSSYHYTESYINGTVIPQLQQVIAQMPPGTAAYRTAVDQLDVWQQTVDLNNTIKTTAPLEVVRQFNGGGAGMTQQLTSTSTATSSISYNVSLEGGLSAEFGVDIGGSGVSAGGELKMRNEYGKGVNGSNENTNTMSYHLQDAEASDDFSVQVRRDTVFGTYAFELDSATSRTSCPYEGGYQLEQPQLWVGAMGQGSMLLENVPIGTTATYPIYACNNSNYPRAYVLNLEGQSNPNGAIITGYNGITSSSSVTLTLPANACDVNVGYIYLTQPAPSVLTFDNIRLLLSSNCGDDIASSVLISAHFGISTGMDEASAPSWLSVQPNPSNGHFQLHTSSTDGSPIHISVRNGLGQEVIQPFSVGGQPVVDMDMGGVVPGLYYMTATRNGEQHVQKVMVQR